MLFNTGKSELPSLRIMLDEGGIHVNRFCKVESIPWESFSNYTVSPHPFKAVSLKAKDGKRMEIDYYSFSKDQWSQIFAILRSKGER